MLPPAKTLADRADPGTGQSATGQYDAVILGGGPAGASAATCLAQGGRRVLVIERARFPRFHVGESFLPLANPLLARLGIDAALGGVASVAKYGATFCTDDGERSARVDFEEAPDVPDPRSFHALRAEFDSMLLNKAREAGAEVWEDCTALEVNCDTQLASVRVLDARGQEQQLEARFLLDATGRRGLISKQLDLRVADPELRKTALFAHFRGVPHLPGRAAGDIQVIVREGSGWGWMIPLPDDRMSIGFVFDNDEQPKELRESPDACMDRWIAKLALLDGCRETLERTSPARWEADFSYSTKAYGGNNWLLLGDAGSFLDPVFSSGVQLALASGVEAADTVEACLAASPAAARRARERFDRTQRRRYEFFRRLVLGFYRPIFRELMLRPEVWPAGARSLACMLAGQDRPRWSTRLRVSVFFLIVSLKERFEPQPQ